MWRKIALLVAAVAFAGIIVSFLIPRETAATPAFEGTALPQKPAPDFMLSDQFGHRISLSRFRGSPVVLTFLEAHCTEQCPLVTEKIRSAIDQLRRAGKRITVVAVSTDPRGDTPSAIRQFSSEHRMLHRWHYVNGTRAQLDPIWHAYYVYVPPASAPESVQGNHVSATYLIDSAGQERVLLAGDPDLTSLTGDLRILSGLPPLSSGQPVYAPRVGAAAPPFSLRAPNGRSIRLDQYLGKVVIMNFWATNCPPCRREMPLLQAWYRTWKDKGLVVIGVDRQEGANAVSGFVRSVRVTYPIALDADGTVASRYDVYALPWTFVIGRDGSVRTFHPGMLDAPFFASSVRPMLTTQS